MDTRIKNFVIPESTCPNWNLLLTSKSNWRACPALGMRFLKLTPAQTEGGRVVKLTSFECQDCA